MERQEILDRLRQVTTIIRECEIIVNSIDSPFWDIVRRTLKSQVEIYKQDAYSAAETEDKSIRNFLGRMQGLEWTLNLVERDFADQYQRAREEKQTLEEQLVEVERLDRDVESIITDPMLQNPGLV